MKALVFQSSSAGRLGAIRGVIKRRWEYAEYNHCCFWRQNAPFFGKVNAKHMWKQRRLNYGSFNMTVNALHKFKVMFENTNPSDHSPEVDTQADRHFDMSQKPRAQIWCMKYTHNADTCALVYLCKNLLLGVFGRNPLIKWFGEGKWPKACGEVSFAAGLRGFN